MNRKKVFIIYVIVAFFLGTLLHFSFDFFHRNSIIGAFSAVNESTWEHLKLLFFPTLILCLFDRFYFYKGNLLYDFLSILGGIIVIIVVFYTYTGIIGTNFLFMDILTFAFGIIATFLIKWKIEQDQIIQSPIFNILGAFGLSLLLLLFVVFTFCPPHIQLFIDPITKLYGIV